jgi:hypothetical protein
MPIRPASRVLTALMVCLLAMGLWQIGEGSWIYVKAKRSFCCSGLGPAPWQVKQP